MIRNILLEYRDATVSFIDAMSYDKNPSKYIKIRQDKIEKLKSLEFEKEELKNLWEELGLENLEEEAINILKKEKLRINKTMLDIKKNKSANRVYGNNFKDIYFINKQI